MLKINSRLSLAGLAASFLMGCVTHALAYDVETDSTGNAVYMLLLNENPGAVFHSITLGDSSPGFVTAATATIVPETVLGGGSDLAALEFDVIPGATIGSTGDLVLTVSGLAAGTPISVVFTVPLEVVASASAAQGFVGAGVPAPDPGGLDTDGDGVTDSLELAYGSNPNQAGSLPGQVQQDTDGDGVLDSSDPAPTDPCIPSTFVSVCAFDTDGDSKLDRDEGEFTDTDSDGALDYAESSVLDADGDTYPDEVDAANNDACLPDPLATNCDTPTESVPLFGLPGYFLLALLLSALGITQVQRRTIGGVK